MFIDTAPTATATAASIVVRRWVPGMYATNQRTRLYTNLATLLAAAERGECTHETGVKTGENNWPVGTFHHFKDAAGFLAGISTSYGWGCDPKSAFEVSRDIQPLNA